MRIFLTGATGAVGRHLVPMLVAEGYEVTGTTRTPGRAEALRAAGAEPVLLDVLDRPAVLDAVGKAEPEVVIHQATALAGAMDLRHFDRFFATTNRLRAEGTDTLLEAAGTVGARQLIAQSFAGWPYARTGGPVKTEDDPLDPDPAGNARQTLAAIEHLEAAVTGAPGITGTVLRYGAFYGPGTSLARGVELAEMVRRRRFPIVGSGAGIFSFCHIEDAAAATAAAVRTGAGGIFNVVDDEPARVSEWLPVLAQVLRGPRPRRVPAWLARGLLGGQGTVMMTSARGASNAKAKRELGWTPAYPSWRDGFRRGLG
jgi:nucleoside-diphosphate-sugar epimerase